MRSNFRVYESHFERFNYAVTEHKKIFGTDGVRGIANVEPVTAETALKLGRAAAYVFAQLNPRRTPAGARPKIVLGKDTRLSGTTDTSWMIKSKKKSSSWFSAVRSIPFGRLRTKSDAPRESMMRSAVT